MCQNAIQLGGQVKHLTLVNLWFQDNPNWYQYPPSSWNSWTDQIGGSAHILSSVCTSTCTFGICASTVQINQCVTQWIEIVIVIEK